MKADPVLNDYLLEKERNRKRARTRKRQDKKIDEARRNIMAQCKNIVECYGLSWQALQTIVTSVLYPERLIK